MCEKALGNQEHGGRGNTGQCVQWEKLLAQACNSNRAIAKLSCSLTLSFSDCNEALFRNTLKLRRKRLHIEKALTEEKKVAADLRKKYNAFAKKVL